MTESSSHEPDLESAVRTRYSAAAHQPEASLCCPVSYDPRYLEVIPEEVLERDYGCGDPSRFVREGDVVLDLGSGAGKICFIAAQVAGAGGRVIGVDVNPDMLALSRRAAPIVSSRLGYQNVEFRRGRIQDLALDLDRLDAWLETHPVRSSNDWAALEARAEALRSEAPLVAAESIDVVVSNCVLNLVRPQDKAQLFDEMCRVLKVDGRIAISDIVSDAPVPESLRENPELFSGCVSGAFEESELFERLGGSGFHGIRIEEWESEVFATVEGIEFRSVTLTAHKSEREPRPGPSQSIIYRGPWRQVEDDAGHVLRRGERAVVDAGTFDILTREPYAADLVQIEGDAGRASAGRGCC